MELLLDLAEGLLEEFGQEPPRPNFPFPSEVPDTDALLELRPDGLKGRGWYAKRAMEAGTVLMVSKPLAMMMDWQDPDVQEDQDFDPDEDHEEDESDQYVLSKLNELLLLELCRAVNRDPSLWTDKLSKLFPRDEEDMLTLTQWVCQMDALFSKFGQEVKQLKEHFGAEETGAIMTRLPLVVRYNVLSVETCPELLVHPSPSRGFSGLSGAGLYFEPSYFNHDAHPNVSRYAVGDVMWFVANQVIAEGQECCLSYLEHEVLCEAPFRRNAMLEMDFTEPVTMEEDGLEDGQQQEQHNEDDGPLFPVIDAMLQNELMQMETSERLQAIQELMEQALGERLPEDERVIPEDGELRMEGGLPVWFQCDVQNLRILQALTLEAMGQHRQAMSVWELCIQYCTDKLPPNDEALVVVLVQGALCAQCCAEEDEKAQQYAAKALQVHHTIFGGSMERFRRRYEREFQLALRPDGCGANPDELWPPM